MVATVETSRLLLRPFVEDDVAAFLQLATAAEVTRYTGDDGLVKTLDDALRVLRAHPLADYAKYGYGRWACVLKSTGDVIGFCGLKFLEDLHEVDLGYRLLPQHWGAGLATEAARASVRFAFDTLRMQEIIGLVVPENIASVRVLEKVGLTLVGPIEYRGHQVAKYAMRADQ